LYKRYKRRKFQNDDLDELIQQCIGEANNDVNYDNNHPVHDKKPRSCYKKNISLRGNGDGELVPIEATSSSWYVTYVMSPDIHDNKFIKKFCCHFRCSYQSFLNLLELVKEDIIFDRWQRLDAAGRMSSPVALLLLGVLRCIGRGWTFDDLEDIGRNSSSVLSHIYTLGIH
jgi:hypothetical protein